MLAATSTSTTCRHCCAWHPCCMNVRCQLYTHTHTQLYTHSCTHMYDLLFHPSRNCCRPAAFMCSAGGEKTWLATDKRFLAENFTAPVGQSYGVHLTKKLGATRQFVDALEQALGSGSQTVASFTESWNALHRSNWDAASRRWLQHLGNNRHQYFTDPAVGASASGVAPRPAPAQDQGIRRFFQKAPPELVDLTTTSAAEEELLRRIGPVNEEGFPLQLVMATKDALFLSASWVTVKLHATLRIHCGRPDACM